MKMNSQKINTEVKSRFGEYKYDGINYVQCLYDLLKLEINSKEFIKTNKRRVNQKNCNAAVIKKYNQKEKCLMEIDKFYELLFN